MKYILALFILVGCSFISCKKQPGEGGFASIEGKVYVNEYDTYFTYITGRYYLPGENVYIIYGDGTEVANSVKTSYDGSFKFNYLRKGTYKIFVVGEDSASANLGNPKDVLREVTITKRKEKQVLDDIVILHN
ncbi:MAG: hypothetical protein V4580_16120 [Bacteroidota bacterium]